MMRRTAAAGTFIALALLPLIAARSQDPPSERPMEMHMLSANGLFLITGGGGNTLALESEGGVIVVDTKQQGWGSSILAAINGVSDRRVTNIINTQADPDHTGSNAALGAAEIIAHENTKIAMAKLDAFKGGGARFLPNRTFTDRLSLLDGIDRIELYHFGAGHTSGDIVVVFPAARVAYFGDLFPDKSAPSIDTNNGGSAVSFPDTLAKAAATITGVDRVIPGHALPPPGLNLVYRSNKWLTWDDVQEYARFNRDFLAATEAALRAGRTADAAVEDVKAALVEKYKGYGMEQAKANVHAIYAELAK